MDLPAKRPEKIKLNEINRYLSCYLCKGYLIDATTISECLHSFCRSCIIKFLEENSYCPVCEVIINKAKPNLKLDKTLQDIVYKLVPELFIVEMTRRKKFYQKYPQLAARVTPEERGEDTERTIFSPQEKISLSLEYIRDDSAPGAIRIPAIVGADSDALKSGDETPESLMKRYLLCPGMCRIDVLKKFVRNKYSVDTSQFYIDILYKRVPLPDHYTLIDIAYIYSWQRNETMKFFFRITDINKAPKRFDYFDASQTVPEFVPKPSSRTRSYGNSPAKRRSVPKTTPVKVMKETLTPPPPPPLPPPPPPAPAKSDTNECDNCTSEVSKSDKTESVVPSDGGYTKIVLDRANNVEIVTKVDQVKPPTKIILSSKKTPKPKAPVQNDDEDEKSRFFKSIELTAKSSLTPPSKKRKSPIIKPFAKVPKTDKKKPVKIVLQEKRRDNGLQSLIDSCKINIPSSLSITIKESSEESAKQPVAPPVKNYIEILKLPDENTPKLDTSKFSDNDSEQKVDQDLSEIAKSLTEKIPMSTTISHIVGPKQQFPIPVKSQNKVQIQPSPVPEVSKVLAEGSPKSFQKIFEESIKKPAEALDLTSEQTTTPVAKRKATELTTQLCKKIKKEVLPKVAIPRLPHQRTFRVQVPQTVASLHSTSLGMNYTVSVGQTSPTKTSKVNGTVSPVKAESPASSPLKIKTEFKVPSPSLGSPKLPEASPKQSPKSSPVVKHMYGPGNQKLNRFANISPKLPTKSSPTSPASSSSPPTNPLSPNEILEKYNIQNLAQLTASLNFNPAVLALTAPANQLAALQHAMLLKHFEMHQNRQSWLTRNQGPLLQYEKYLQSLNGGAGQGPLVKEN